MTFSICLKTKLPAMRALGLAFLSISISIKSFMAAAEHRHSVGDRIPTPSSAWQESSVNWPSKEDSALAIEALQAISVVKGGCPPNSHRQATTHSGIDAPSELPT
jgi:hypothetical protein